MNDETKPHATPKPAPDGQAPVTSDAPELCTHGKTSAECWEPGCHPGVKHVNRPEREHEKPAARRPAESP
jgi:hypothetical protein